MTSGVWRCGDHELPFGSRTLVMGVVNVTPDSFSDGGRSQRAPDAVSLGLSMLAHGADIVDIGGESTRPGSDPVALERELERVIPVIEGLRAAAPKSVISVDTRRAHVAAPALAAGASIVNDVTAGADPEMFAVVASAEAGMVLMHMLGEPKTMQDDPRYDDVVHEVRDALATRVAAAEAAGIARDRVCIDPGIGFGKNLDHNLSLLRRIDSFGELGVPVLVGVSRKRFIGQLTGVDEPSARVDGTAGAVAWCAARKVAVVRVHDVREMVHVVRVVDAIAGVPA